MSPWDVPVGDVLAPRESLVNPPWGGYGSGHLIFYFKVTSRMSNVPAIAKEKKPALQVDDIGDPIVKQALKWRFEGHTWEECAAKFKEIDFKGVRGGEIHYADLWKRCKPYEIMIQQDEAFETLKRTTLSAAQEAISQLEEALVRKEIPKTSLAVNGGILVDKFTRMMQVEKQPEQAQSPLMAMLQELQKTGGTLKLEVSQPKTIDAEIVGE